MNCKACFQGRSTIHQAAYGGSQRFPSSPRRSRFPARHVLDLFGGKRVDRNSERAQLKARDFLIDFRWQQMYARIELAFVLHQVLN